MASKKQQRGSMRYGLRYDASVKEGVLAALDSGMSSAQTAAKYKVSYQTVRGWDRERALMNGKSKSRRNEDPAPEAAPAPAAKLEAKREATDTKSEDSDRMSVALREHRRLRAMLNSLLDRANGATGYEALSSLNRQLQLVVDLLLGVD